MPPRKLTIHASFQRTRKTTINIKTDALTPSKLMGVACMFASRTWKWRREPNPDPIHFVLSDTVHFHFCILLNSEVNKCSPNTIVSADLNKLYHAKMGSAGMRAWASSIQLVGVIKLVDQKKNVWCDSSQHDLSVKPSLYWYCEFLKVTNQTELYL